jgi:hypothetical protein
VYVSIRSVRYYLRLLGRISAVAAAGVSFLVLAFLAILVVLVLVHHCRHVGLLSVKIFFVVAAA